jgi:hypothetical protein
LINGRHDRTIAFFSNLSPMNGFSVEFHFF